jgi:hypothetical protein
MRTRRGALKTTSSSEVALFFLDPTLYLGAPGSKRQYHVPVLEPNIESWRATLEIVCIKSHMGELKVLWPQTKYIWYKNLGATYVITNPIFPPRAKALNLKFCPTSCGLKTATPPFLFT